MDEWSMCYCAALFHFIADGAADCFRGVAELLMIPEWSLLWAAALTIKSPCILRRFCCFSPSNLFHILLFQYIDLVNLP